MAQAAGMSRQFVKSAMSAPFLERAEERSLAVRWREADDESALHQLAHAHMRLVMAVAMRFRHYGLPVADLVQEGSLNAVSQQVDHHGALRPHRGDHRAQGAGAGADVRRDQDVRDRLAVAGGHRRAGL